jgi:hypothetical protein
MGRLVSRAIQVTAPESPIASQTPPEKRPDAQTAAGVMAPA